MKHPVLSVSLSVPESRTVCLACPLQKSPLSALKHEAYVTQTCLLQLAASSARCNTMSTDGQQQEEEKSENARKKDTRGRVSLTWPVPRVPRAARAPHGPGLKPLRPSVVRRVSPRSSSSNE